MVQAFRYAKDRSWTDPARGKSLRRSSCRSNIRAASIWRRKEDGEADFVVRLAVAVVSVRIIHRSVDLALFRLGEHIQLPIVTSSLPAVESTVSNGIYGSSIGGDRRYARPKSRRAEQIRSRVSCNCSSRQSQPSRRFAASVPAANSPSISSKEYLHVWHAAGLDEY